MRKSVDKKANTEIGGVIDYGEYVGKGFENQTQDDISIPFLGLLQPLSPQVETNENAKPGMLINTVTEELYDTIDFVPATTQHVWVEWVPRKKGGGFVSVYQIDSPIVAKAKEASNEFGKYKTDEDNDLVETFYVYGMLIENDSAIGMAVIAFTSSKIKVYKGFNTRIKMFTIDGKDGGKINPPLFAHRVTVSTIKLKKNNETFHNFVIKPYKGNVLDSLLKPDDPIFQAAVECSTLIAKGKASAAYESQNTVGTEEEPPAVF